MYSKKSKRYYEFFNNPTKLHMTRESVKSVDNLIDSHEF